MPPSTGATVLLGDEQVTLRYTAPALRKIQSKLGGASLQETVSGLSDVSIEHILVMVWGGLLHESPDLRIEQVVDQLEPPLHTAIEAIMEALDPWIQPPGVEKKGAQPPSE